MTGESNTAESLTSESGGILFSSPVHNYLKIGQDEVGEFVHKSNKNVSGAKTLHFAIVDTLNLKLKLISK